ncbi:methionyl-tRNA formyltransferase [Corynebacterium rhinophilum]|uniref:methionyl-tRNA formyltransferase n=1 Tax=Corynebacterium rhinophilum TaxID=3050197 RepID=UPI00254F8084|nr:MULTISPECIES: methionyl-tRNA formyltransferase [unclassified Corynebacterium]MDK8701590.1 methionyl-tRNA formyltransferase [Corynebacterium sp. MSK107]MDK8703870.1 methionyl-tRNA formyltransferase [Corynebacterium sp. MSK090]
MRIIFAGTPEPAVVALEKLLASSHEVVAVITRPDAKKGRGRTFHPSPVKALAQEHGIEVLTPSTLRPGTEDGDNLRQRLAELQPEAIPVVAYGNLISKDLLDVARHGWVNLHFSLLPAWRGAAPVQAAIAAGDDITGASTFRIEEGLDTGPVFGTVTEGITGTDTADDLLTRLAYSGADLLVATMDGLEAGTLEPQAQSGEATYAPKISTAAARIDWAQPAFAIDRHIRAHTPGPGAWTLLDDARLKLGPVRLNEGIGKQLQPGEALISKDAVYIGTATQPVQLDRIQPPGKKMMNAADWARGLGKNAEVRFQ